MTAHTEIYEEVCDDAAKLGNYPIDLLACVPPSLVLGRASRNTLVARARPCSQGKKVWDASSVDVREHFPTDRDALRIVQYDSCRGLEGWAVINYGFDDFWEYKCPPMDVFGARSRQSLRHARRACGSIRIALDHDPVNSRHGHARNKRIGPTQCSQTSSRESSEAACRLCAMDQPLISEWNKLRHLTWEYGSTGAVSELVGIDGGVVSGVINLESSGVEASDWRPRHEERYHEA